MGAPDPLRCRPFRRRREEHLEDALAIVSHDPPGVFPPYRGYNHAVSVRGDARRFFVSGLNGYEADGQTLPASFEEQGELEAVAAR